MTFHFFWLGTLVGAALLFTALAISYWRSFGFARPSGQLQSTERLLTVTVTLLAAALWGWAFTSYFHPPLDEDHSIFLNVFVIAGTLLLTAFALYSLYRYATMRGELRGTKTDNLSLTVFYAFVAVAAWGGLIYYFSR